MTNQTAPVPGEGTLTVEAACEVMHDAYEAAAVEQGWETQARSRKPWSDAPEANKATMRVAVAALMDRLAAYTPGLAAAVEYRVVRTHTGQEVGVGVTENQETANTDAAAWRRDGYPVTLQRRTCGPWGDVPEATS